MGRNIFSKEQVEEIRKLYKGGLSSVKLGKMFNCDHTTILSNIGTLKRKLKNTQPIHIPHRHPSYTIKPVVKPQLDKKPQLDYDEIRKKQESKKFIRNEVGELIEVLTL